MKTLLIDLDDTLLDYTGGADESWREACHAVAAPAGVDAIALAGAIGRARRWFWDDPVRATRERLRMLDAWRTISAHALAELGVPDPAMAAAIAEDFAARRWQRMALFPGVEDALHRVRARGVSLALVTNGDVLQQRRKVERYDLARFFDVILIEGEFGAGKPDESVYRHVLSALRTDPSDAWMVGDNLEWDVAAPQRLGLRGVWVDAHGRGVPSPSPTRPDLIVRTFAEFVGAVTGGETGTGPSRAAPSGRGQPEQTNGPV
jgi:putative hydrolase of the HAD superfamily